MRRTTGARIVNFDGLFKRQARRPARRHPFRDRGNVLCGCRMAPRHGIRPPLGAAAVGTSMPLVIRRPRSAGTPRRPQPDPWGPGAVDPEAPPQPGIPVRLPVVSVDLVAGCPGRTPAPSTSCRVATAGPPSSNELRIAVPPLEVFIVHQTVTRPHQRRMSLLARRHRDASGGGAS
jgi:hypothetical protein